MEQSIDLRKSESQIEIDKDSDLKAVFVGRGKDSIRTKIDFVHSLPDLNSNITIKAVLYDESRFDIEGNLIIEKGASRTDTYLKIDILMLSEKASARAVPSLEIFEDDVKGGHGATVGQVDEEQLFYLMARGLNKEEAQDVLVAGFIGEDFMTSDE